MGRTRRALLVATTSLAVLGLLTGCKPIQGVSFTEYEGRFDDKAVQACLAQQFPVEENDLLGAVDTTLGFIDEIYSDLGWDRSNDPYVRDRPSDTYAALCLVGGDVAEEGYGKRALVMYTLQDGEGGSIVWVY